MTKRPAKKSEDKTVQVLAAAAPVDTGDIIDRLRQEIVTLQSGNSTPIRARALAGLATTIIRVQDHEMRVERFVDERAHKRSKSPSVARYPRPVMIGSR